MEGNLNQFMALQGEHDSEERRSNRTPEECYMVPDEDLTSFNREDSSCSRCSEGASLASRTIQRSPKTPQWHPSTLKPAGDDVESAINDKDSESLYGAIRTLEKTINNHCSLLSRKYVKNKSGMGKVDSRVSLGHHVSRARTRGEKVNIYIRVVFLKIGEIDTLKETFSADAYVQAKWREPALDGMTQLNIDEIEWDKYWNPKLFIENNLGDPKETVWQTLMFNKQGEATVYERRRTKGVFLENLELDEFPFDTQDLTLTITSERSEQELQIEEDSSEISSINVQSFVDEQEWKLHNHVETWKRVTTKIYQNSKYKHPAISASCRASRRPGFFVWNIFLVMLFICSLCFSTFTVELTLPQNRLQLSFILLLTTITFKFVVSQTLPRISYLTYLDKYILTSMGILCAVCVWHSVVPLMATNMSLAITADRCVLVILGTSYFMFHVCFFMYIYFVALKKRWKYNEKDKEHKERVKTQQRQMELDNAGENQWNAITIEPM